MMTTALDDLKESTTDELANALSDDEFLEKLQAALAEKHQAHSDWAVYFKEDNASEQQRQKKLALNFFIAHEVIVMIRSLRDQPGKGFGEYKIPTSH